MSLESSLVVLEGEDVPGQAVGLIVGSSILLTPFVEGASPSVRRLPTSESEAPLVVRAAQRVEFPFSGSISFAHLEPEVSPVPLRLDRRLLPSDTVAFCEGIRPLRLSESPDLVSTGEFGFWQVRGEALVGSPVVTRVDDEVPHVVGIVFDNDDGWSSFVATAALARWIPEIEPWCGWRAFESDAIRQLWRASTDSGIASTADYFADRELELEKLSVLVTPKLYAADPEQDDRAGRGGAAQPDAGADEGEDANKDEEANKGASADRRPEHVLVIGPSGAGKSSVVARLAAEHDGAIRGLDRTRTTVGGQDTEPRPRIRAWIDARQIKDAGDFVAAVARSFEAEVAIDRLSSESHLEELETVLASRLGPHLVVLDGVKTSYDLTRVTRTIKSCTVIQFIISATLDAYEDLDADLRETYKESLLVEANVPDEKIEAYLVGIGLPRADARRLAPYAQGNMLLAGLLSEGVDVDENTELEIVIQGWVEGLLRSAARSDRELEILRGVLWLCRPTLPLELLRQREDGEEVLTTLDHAAGELSHLCDFEGDALRIRHDLFMGAVRSRYWPDIKDLASLAEVGSALAAQDSAEELLTSWSDLVCDVAIELKSPHHVVEAYPQSVELLDLGGLAAALRTVNAGDARCRLLEQYSPSWGSHDWLRSIDLALNGEDASSDFGRFSWEEVDPLLIAWRPLPELAIGSRRVTGLRLDKTSGEPVPIADLASYSANGEMVISSVPIDVDSFWPGAGGDPVRSNRQEYDLKGEESRNLLPAPHFLTEHLRECFVGKRHLIYSCSDEGRPGVFTLVGSGGGGAHDQVWADPGEILDTMAERPGLRAAVNSDGTVQIDLDVWSADGSRTAVQLVRHVWSRPLGVRIDNNGIVFTTTRGRLRFWPNPGLELAKPNGPTSNS